MNFKTNFKKATMLVIFAFFIFIVIQSFLGSSQPVVKEEFNNKAQISDARRVHILYGDETGGGHIYGANKPCKSEFPKNWSADKIIEEIKLIAANDNLNWKQESNGYYVTEQPSGDLEIRVVKAQNKQNVITAYPINVSRNPCLANDN